MNTIKNKAYLEINLCGQTHTIESNEVEVMVFETEEEKLKYEMEQSKKIAESK